MYSAYQLGLLMNYACKMKYSFILKSASQKARHIAFSANREFMLNVLRVFEWFVGQLRSLS